MKILLFITGNRDDYLTSDVIEGLVELEDAKEIELFSYIVPDFQIGNGIQYKHQVNKKSILNNLDKIDYIFIFVQNPHFPKNENTLEGSPLKDLEEFNVWDKCVYFDGTEYNWSSKTQYVEKGKNPRIEPFNFTYMLKKCKYYFKRECYPEDIKMGLIFDNGKNPTFNFQSKVIPLPFAFSLKRRFVSDPSFDIKNKSIDIFCSFPQYGTGLRYEILCLCECIKKNFPQIKVDTSNDLAYKEYAERINRSFITLDQTGGGIINMRPFEIVANGSVLFRHKYPVIIPNDFVTEGENKMIVEYTSIEDLTNKLVEYLNKKEELIEMSKRAFKHLMKYHTCRARADYVMGILKVKN